MSRTQTSDGNDDQRDEHDEHDQRDDNNKNDENDHDDHDRAAAIARGYDVTGAALDLGAVVIAGTTHGDAQVRLPMATLNRHGLIAGATGTGKTRTLQLLAEQCSAAGVPVFLADMKGDLSGLAAPGRPSDALAERSEEVGDDWAPGGCPVQFYALGGAGTGVPLRATITSFGPLLLSKVLDLNETQESTLGLVFHYADEAGLPLLDLKDLRAVITHLTSDEGKDDLERLGGISPATAAVLLRKLISLVDMGADTFFGEPEFDAADLLRIEGDRGVISAVELAGVQNRPSLFSTFLMWLLADLLQDLPEVGDQDRPKLVFFFDEAHLLFTGASAAFVEQVVSTVRMIRSKGVAIFFVTQHPTDLPDDVLGQLGNRVQHALRAFTPDDATALAKTARTYPTTEDYDIGELLTSLGTGEAVVTVLSEKGRPTPVAWTRLRAPRALMTPLPVADLTASVDSSPLTAKYREMVDRDSAYERLAAKFGAPEPGGNGSKPKKRRGQKPADTEGGGKGDALEAVRNSSALRQFARSAASAVGREFGRGVFDVGKRRRR